jgi:hypothetical protein
MLTAWVTLHKSHDLSVFSLINDALAQKKCFLKSLARSGAMSSAHRIQESDNFP